MCADTHDDKEREFHPKAVHFNAFQHLLSRKGILQNTAGPYMWSTMVGIDHIEVSSLSEVEPTLQPKGPLLPRHQTQSGHTQTGR